MLLLAIVAVLLRVEEGCQKAIEEPQSSENSETRERIVKRKSKVKASSKESDRKMKVSKKHNEFIQPEGRAEEEEYEEDNEESMWSPSVGTESDVMEMGRIPRKRGDQIQSFRAMSCYEVLGLRSAQPSSRPPILEMSRATQQGVR